MSALEMSWIDLLIVPRFCFHAVANSLPGKSGVRLSINAGGRRIVHDIFPPAWAAEA